MISYLIFCPTSHCGPLFEKCGPFWRLHCIYNINSQKYLMIPDKMVYGQQNYSMKSRYFQELSVCSSYQFVIQTFNLMMTNIVFFCFLIIVIYFTTKIPRKPSFDNILVNW